MIAVEKKFKQTWRNVVYRCTNPNDKRYNYYSKVGIDKAWLMFENFKDDMLDSFVEHFHKHGARETTIDRIDNKKGYSKENCRWATWQQQRKNMQSGPDGTYYPINKILRFTKTQSEILAHKAAKESKTRSQVLREYLDSCA